jgi:hypothetical protein
MCRIQTSSHDEQWLLKLFNAGKFFCCMDDYEKKTLLTSSLAVIYEQRATMRLIAGFAAGKDVGDGMIVVSGSLEMFIRAGEGDAQTLANKAMLYARISGSRWRMRQYSVSQLETDFKESAARMGMDAEEALATLYARVPIARR